MTCEEFEAIGLDAERDASLSEVERVVAREHASTCSRCAALAGASALDVAAVLAGTVSWRNWRKSGPEETAKHLKSPLTAAKPINANAETNRETPVQSAAAVQNSDAAESGTLMADNEMSDFTLLPGALPADTGDAEILRVRMQRRALGALGLPVNEERAGEWIQGGLLRGNDGLPEEVGFPQKGRDDRTV